MRRTYEPKDLSEPDSDSSVSQPIQRTEACGEGVECVVSYEIVDLSAEEIESYDLTHEVLAGELYSDIENACLADGLEQAQEKQVTLPIQPPFKTEDANTHDILVNVSALATGQMDVSATTTKTEEDATTHLPQYDGQDNPPPLDVSVSPHSPHPPNPEEGTVNPQSQSDFLQEVFGPSFFSSPPATANGPQTQSLILTLDQLTNRFNATATPVPPELLGLILNAKSLSTGAGDGASTFGGLPSFYAEKISTKAQSDTSIHQGRFASPAAAAASETPITNTSPPSVTSTTSPVEPLMPKSEELFKSTVLGPRPQQHRRPSSNKNAKIKPTFACESCSFATLYKRNLLAHVKEVHMKDKREHVCPRCERYKTSRRSNLLQHIRVVHDDIKEFSCGVCGYKTSRKRTLDKHMKQLHWENVSMPNGFESVFVPAQVFSEISSNMKLEQVGPAEMGVSWSKVGLNEPVDLSVVQPLTN